MGGVKFFELIEDGRFVLLDPLTDLGAYGRISIAGKIGVVTGSIDRGHDEEEIGVDFERGLLRKSRDDENKKKKCETSQIPSLPL